jgi:hypothetical protein
MTRVRAGRSKVRIAAGARDIFSTKRPFRLRAHPASYSARTAGIFPGVKRSEREDGHLTPSVLRMSTTVPTLSPCAVMVVLSPHLFSFALEYVTGKIQVN